MKIAYAAVSQVPSRAANSVHVMRMSAAFARAGHDVTLFLPSDTEESLTDVFEYYGAENIFGIQRAAWPPIRGKAFFFALDVARKAKAASVDLLYSRSIAVSAFAITNGIPTVLEMHGPITDKSVIERIMFRWLVRQRAFRKMVVISGPLKRWFETEGSFPSDRVIVAHDGADVSMAPKAARGPVRTAGYFGGLYEGRGIDIIFEMAKRTPSIDYVIYGGTPQDVEKWQARVGGRENFHLLGHAAPRDVGKLMQKCDVLLAPYQARVAVHGGSGDTAKWMSPLKLFEYMSAGRAIICSDSPVLHEILTPGETALMPVADDINQWVQAISDLDRPELRTRLQEQAYRRLVEDFSWDKRALAVLS
ncbi:glycosyltransferase family 4 protein [Pacificimonas sp. WHA3]|uniref:Glycosyltransferase family 4 protein n=1 Tax=Pacificimonas pallii TaxID=2827236 RepID=A0ABS6SGN5_9SPHN|nr:glycosyltransferase family 4 protein [Pacificimonas pallii]MBV7257574.1 glycosyltransferase family 4 protein [Pacificimonas pallii]